jgi:hypothetical protein
VRPSWVIIGRTGKAACRGQRLSSNYKGFPICQAIVSRAELRSNSARNLGRWIPEAVLGQRKRRQGSGLEELQTVIDAASVLRTLMQDAHGGLIR